MNVNFQSFIEAYQNASQEMKDFIDSDSIGLFIDSMDSRAELKQKLIVFVSNSILGIDSVTDISTKLKSVGVDNDKTIENIVRFIQNNKENPVVSNNKSKETVDMDETVVTPSTPASKPIINPLRTMATDGKGVGYESVEEPVYTSVQNAIINETRWGSDDGK